MFTYKDVIAVTNRKICERPFEVQIERICQRHPLAVVVREKDLCEEEYSELYRKTLKICTKYKVSCIAHTYAEAADFSKEKILHLPLPLLEMQKKRREGITGTSVHSTEDMIRAQACGAAYAFAGHIRATSCKPGLQPRGTGFLEKVCAVSRIPVYAIGGMTASEECVEEMKRHGAAGICVMSECMKW